ncbi:hypothetical protein ACHHYP_13423 [Achlya hypogyna]|uniref:Uncharacterized protein n=1 Tax=Achlya hypogyna TaxID=1202772 RepID=A0A1V9YFH8_ACHHY|nr:hypothetical protein ACHHYP_13423 [Achlya hypogyna]
MAGQVRVRPVEGLGFKELPGNRNETLVAVAGLLYLWAAMACSSYYLLLLSRSFANDLWWPQYNTSGYRVFLVDAINAGLEQKLSGPFDIHALAVDKTYWGSVLPSPHPTYARALVTTQLTDIEYAIGNLRNISSDGVFRIHTMYCWVDFNRQWEVAHTDRRQQRCNDRYRANAAVYLEAVLRNTNWDALLATNGQDVVIAVFDAVAGSSVAGGTWLDDTANANLSIPDEAALWRRANLARFQLQWQNLVSTGLQAQIAVVNALGIESEVELQRTVYASGPWTSNIFNVFLLNEIYFLATCNMSLVRNASNYFLDSQCVYSATAGFEGFVGLNDLDGNFVQQTGAVRDVLGPFLSVDLFVLPVPGAFLEATTSFASDLRKSVADNDTFAGLYRSLTPMAATPRPASWGNNYLFYGGNPMCLNGQAQSYVQPPFSFRDACDAQRQNTMIVAPSSLLFAVALVNDRGNEACASVSSADCHSQVAVAVDLVAALKWVRATRVTLTRDSIASLNISVMQFASDKSGSNYTVLVAPLLETPIFGYAALFEWAAGYRELVAFEGDNGTLVLLSDLIVGLAMDPNTAPLSRATVVVYYLMVYSSCVLVAVALVASVLALRCRLQFNGANLFSFHRIAGSTWLGRPIMLLRGVSAVLLLSTAPIVLSSSHGVSYFELVRPSILEVLVLAGETTWIIYVINECQLVAHPADATSAASISTAAVFVATVILQLISPVVVDTSLQRTCYASDFSDGLTCDMGYVAIGSFARVQSLFAVQGAGLVVSAVSARLHRRHGHGGRPRSALLPGIATALLTSELDAVSSVLTGLVPLPATSSLLDIKLWVTVPSRLAQPVEPFLPSVWQVQGTRRCVGKLLAAVGLMYILGALASSFSYLEVSQVHLANDLIWASFNLTSGHVFLASRLWYLLALGATNEVFYLDDPGINGVGMYDRTVLASPASYGARMMYTNLTDVPGAIAALRRLDACDVPWVFTQYCYLDFAQRWEMAGTAARQHRCGRMTSNGAVFLEALLRNVAWDAWEVCWGSAFVTAFASDLEQINDGRRFLAALSAPPVQVADEVAYWEHHGVATFALQWQNYKFIGLRNTYAVVNALAISYPFTLQHSVGYDRSAMQTTHKMYWALGNDLRNLNGSSLLRASAKFAFANSTPEALYLANGTFLSAPLAAGFVELQAAIGPFGSIDMIYIDVPSVVRATARELMTAVFDRRATSYYRQATFAALPTAFLSNAVPMPWLELDFYSAGGSLLCPNQQMATTSPVSVGLQQLFLFENNCAMGIESITMAPTPDHFVFAALLAKLTPASNVSRICRQVPGDGTACVNGLKALLNWTSELDMPKVLTEEATTAIAALNVSFMQYGAANASSPIELYLTPVLQPEFAFFSWVFIYDWVLGRRDVVSFAGDLGTLTLLSDFAGSMTEPIDAGEFPTVFALYAHSAVIYVTCVMVALAFVTTLYILLSRGRIEGSNMLELSRVGGVVWVGRPLLCVRGFTALCLLATETLTLETSGMLSYFCAKAAPWYTTCLAASEVTWLVGVVNDVGLVVTQENSARYSTLNSVLVWAAAACLTTLLPVRHNVALHRDCDIIILDLQVVCRTATVSVGFWTRIALLVSVVLGCNVVSYTLVRAVCPVTSSQRSQSLLLTAGAKFLFDHHGWMHDGVYYIDRASAVLNGLVSFRSGTRLILFDAKTWRLYPIEHCAPITKSVAKFAFAIPLLDAPDVH